MDASIEKEDCTQRAASLVKPANGETLKCDPWCAFQRLGQIQADYLVDEDASACFSKMLSLLIDLTGSEYGFIGELYTDSADEPFLRAHAIMNIAWDKGAREFYEENIGAGLEFRKPDTLYGITLRTGEAVITNEPQDHPGAAGLPPGHPPLSSYIGLPIYLGGELVGMIGLANCEAGYSDKTRRQIEPVLLACGGMIQHAKAKRSQIVALKSLREREDQFRNLAETLGAIPWELDLAGWRFTYVGPQAEAMLGYPKSAWLEPEFWNDHLHPDDKDWAEKYCVECTSEAKDHQFEYRMITQDGRTVWIHDIVSIVVADGKPARLRGIMIDVTERKHAEDRLASRERVLRHTLENVVEGVIVTDQQGVIRSANPASYKIFGYGEPGLEGKSINILMPERDSKKHDFWIARYREGRESQVIGQGRDLTAVRKSGDKFPIELQISDFFSDGKRMIVATIRDISQRRIAESLDQRLGRILDTSAIEMLVVDAVSYKVVQVSRGALNRFGYLESEFLEQEMDAFLNENEWRQIVEEFENPERKEGDVVSRESQLRRKDGTRFTAEMTIHLSGHEQPPVFVIIVRDLSAEMVAREREKEFDQQINRAQRLQALGQLSAGIAHDLNNILTPILGYSLLLTEDLPKGSPTHEDAEQITIAAKRGRDLVEQILQFGRSREGHHLSLDVGAIAREASRLIQSSMPPHIFFALDLPISGPHISGDEGQVHQLITNLCSNAAQAIGEASGEIRLSIATIVAGESAPPTIGQMPAGECVRITVEDTGPGISPEDMENIFEPFFTTKPVGEGTGLGLPVVHGIVQSHDGAIGVESCPGNGAKFHIYFPSEEVSAADNSGSPTDLSSRQLSVLIVAREIELSRMVAKVLIHAGYEVELAQSGSAALLKLREMMPSIDLVVINSTLPDNSSEELLKDIRKVAGRMPSIIMTSEETQAFCSDPFTGTILKPFSPGLLRDVVSQRICSSNLQMGN